VALGTQMTTFLFWNLNKKPIHAAVTQLAYHYDVDVVLLAECEMPPLLLLQSLNQDNLAAYHYAPGIGCKKIEVFTKFTSDYIQPVFEDSRWTIRHMNLPGLRNILLTVVHLPSKQNYDESDQKSICARLVRDIHAVEHNFSKCEIVVVGDFNMNPFEDGIIAADGMNAAMTKRVAFKESRTVLEKKYRFLYNPMWSLFGDRDPNPPGTYYYQSSGFRSLYWNIFDQVLVSPGLIDRFDIEKLQIPTFDGVNRYLSDSDRPNIKDYSDHLPVIFEIRL